MTVPEYTLTLTTLFSLIAKSMNELLTSIHRFTYASYIFSACEFFVVKNYFTIFKK
jgi:hypothetical protein